MNFLDTIERRLIDAYSIQLEHYSVALGILSCEGTDAELETWSMELQNELDSVAQVELNIANDKSQWKQSEGMPGPELQRLLSEVAVSIRTLTDAIDRRSGELIEKKQRLLPVMDGIIRQRDMLRSYSSHSSKK